jgi:hypothetical protein
MLLLLLLLLLPLLPCLSPRELSVAFCKLESFTATAGKLVC